MRRQRGTPAQLLGDEQRAIGTVVIGANAPLEAGGEIGQRHAGKVGDEIVSLSRRGWRLRCGASPISAERRLTSDFHRSSTSRRESHLAMQSSVFAAARAPSGCERRSASHRAIR